MQRHAKTNTTNVDKLRTSTMGPHRHSEPELMMLTQTVSLPAESLTASGEAAEEKDGGGKGVIGREEIGSAGGSGGGSGGDDSDGCGSGPVSPLRTQSKGALSLRLKSEPVGRHGGTRSGNSSPSDHHKQSTPKASSSHQKTKKDIRYSPNHSRTSSTTSMGRTSEVQPYEGNTGTAEGGEEEELNRDPISETLKAITACGYTIVQETFRKHALARCSNILFSMEEMLAESDML